MGRFRFISKPIKRFYFYYADRVADQWSIIVMKKYTNKYIKKRIKLGLDNEEIIETFNLSNVPGLDEFLNNLQIELDREKSLAHCKVREYWLRRGPRLIIVLFLTILITLGLAYWLIDTNINDQILSVLVGINMMLFNLYMLYQRLIDAISGAMMRIGHKNYTNWKHQIIQH